MNLKMWEHYTKLSIIQTPSSKEGRREMNHVTYANRGGSLMYAMVCNISDLAYVVSVTNIYMANIGCSLGDLELGAEIFE